LIGGNLGGRRHLRRQRHFRNRPDHQSKRGGDRRFAGNGFGWPF
jgi:hypothetical protein